MRPVSLRYKCHLVEAVEVIKAVAHRWPCWTVKLCTTTRPKAVARSRGDDSIPQELKRRVDSRFPGVGFAPSLVKSSKSHDWDVSVMVARWL